MNQVTENGARRLKKWRREIDSIDNQLLRLLNQRARVAHELGAVKIACGLPAYDGRRERQVLARLRAANHGPMSGESVTSIFRRIILETRRIGIDSMRQRRKTLPPQRAKNARAGDPAIAVSRLRKEHSNGH